MKGFIVSHTYRVIGKESCVLLYGRLENDQSFLAIKKFKPYFFIKLKDIKKARKISKEVEFEEAKLTNFDKESMAKVILNSPKEVPDLRSEFKKSKIKTYESDIRFPVRYLIDNNIQGSIDIDGHYESSDTIDRIYKEPDIEATEYTPKNLKILSFDIESDKSQKKIYCISLYSKNYKKSFLISSRKLPGINTYKKESELLEDFREEIIDFDPDIITGWNVIDFDLSLLKEKFKRYKIPFNLGRDNSTSKLRIESSFFRTSKADVSGRMVLDGLDLTRTSFIRLDNYKLDTAAQKLLGKSKLITVEGKAKYEEIDRLFKENKKELVKYNLLDAELAYRIITEADLVDLTVQRSILTGMPLDRVNSSIASLDFIYLRKARERKLVCPSSNMEEKTEPITGGYVKKSVPGIYDNVIVLDFKSLYPSIVKTFNIGPYTYLEKKEKNSIETPSKHYYKKEKGILPELFEDFWKAREKAKSKKDKIASFAIKTVMASFIGVLGNPSCRFFNPNLGNSITRSGQYLIKQTAEKIEAKGYKVIYMDTDSVFIDSKIDSYEKSEKVGKEIEKELNEFYDKYIKKEYKRKSYLELEYEKCYLRFLMPKLRGKEGGAKKRYAGLLKENGKEKIEFVGLEFVRGDWTNASKKFQEELLDRIFHKKEVTKFIKKFVEDLRNGKYDEDLIYRKSIRKDLEEYVKTTPPHVKAARKLKRLESNTIEYYITTDGPEPIQIQKHKIDYDHYIDKQIKPLADSVLSFFDTNFNDLIKGSKQTSLFDHQ
jgi:DNA polymerase-2